MRKHRWTGVRRELDTGQDIGGRRTREGRLEGRSEKTGGQE
jgi:hypothetical protein